MRKIICLLILTITYSTTIAQENHIINLSLDIKPYTNLRDINAQIFINHQLRTSANADNTPFARIYKEIPKLKDDSIIEIKIAVFKPLDYIPLEMMPFRYYPGDDRCVNIVSTKWCKEHGYEFAKAKASKKQFDSSNAIIGFLLKENLYSASIDEINLNLLQSENYAALGNFKESFNSLDAISVNKLKVLSPDKQRIYFTCYFDKFEKSAFNDSNYSRNSTELVALIHNNDTTNKDWKKVTGKLFETPVSKSVQAAYFVNPVQSESVLSMQVDEFRNKIIVKDQRQKTAQMIKL